MAQRPQLVRPPIHKRHLVALLDGLDSLWEQEAEIREIRLAALLAKATLCAAVVDQPVAVILKNWTRDDDAAQRIAREAEEARLLL